MSTAKRRIQPRKFPSNSDSTEQNLSLVLSPIITATDLTKKTLPPEGKVLKLIVPQNSSSSSIKMLTNSDGLSSALRIPTKIQLTKLDSCSSPILSEQQNHLKRHSFSFSNWSLASSTSIDLKIKEHYQSLSFSCPILPFCREKVSKSKQFSRKNRSLSPVIKYSSIERLKRRRRDHQLFAKRHKLKASLEQDQECSIVQNLLNEMIETLADEQQSNDMTVLQRANVSHCLSELNDQLYARQTSTPLSFHSVASSTATDNQLVSSPIDHPKTQIFTDIVNELIKGAKGLDKLSYSLTSFTNSIHDFIRLKAEKQNEKVENLQNELEKKCSTQFNRANLFCTKKIQYFLSKHSIESINDYLDEITLIVKYFYFYVLFLNYRKQENEYEEILTNLISGKFTFINELFCSSILTTIIEEFILSSTLANEYLLAQPILINQIEYSVPFIRNHQYEKELLCQNEISLTINPFVDLNDLENYLNSCEHLSPNIPYYPLQQSSISYPLSNSYYSTPYHYSFSYNHPSPYYNNNPHLSAYTEQYNYYYNPNQMSIASPNFHQQSYRRINTSYPERQLNSSQIVNTPYPSE